MTPAGREPASCQPRAVAHLARRRQQAPGRRPPPTRPTLFATSFFKSQAPDTWKIPLVGPYDSPPGTPRGVDSSFALAKVSFNNVLNTFSGKPALQKFVYSATKLAPTERYGVYWTLTDLATAKEMGLTPVAIRKRGREVRAADRRVPLAAAVPTMTKQADGTLLPNPASKANPDAYPLSFVEYACRPTPWCPPWAPSASPVRAVPLQPQRRPAPPRRPCSRRGSPTPPAPARATCRPASHRSPPTCRRRRPRPSPRSSARGRRSPSRRPPRHRPRCLRPRVARSADRCRSDWASPGPAASGATWRAPAPTPPWRARPAPRA